MTYSPHTDCHPLSAVEQADRAQWPNTPIGVRLRELREKAIADGMPLLSADEVNAELASRRGGPLSPTTPTDADLVRDLLREHPDVVPGMTSEGPHWFYIKDHRWSHPPIALAYARDAMREWIRGRGWVVMDRRDRMEAWLPGYTIASHMTGTPTANLCAIVRKIKEAT